MIDSVEVERHGRALAQVLARYSTAELRKIMEFAYLNRVKGGAMPRLARLLEEFAVVIRSPITHRSHRSSDTSQLAADGNH
jgi:hypothetical protein